MVAVWRTWRPLELLDYQERFNKVPTKDEHINWAKHDRNFWTSIDLDDTPFTDWAVTGMFYESLHLVEAFLDTKGCHSGKHSERNRNMSLYVSELGPILADYGKLRQDSQTCRYDCSQIHTASEARQFIPIVDNIRNHISSLISCNP